ncbi:hypothetical protein [Streptomyces sp. NPDC003327]
MSSSPPAPSVQYDPATGMLMIPGDPAKDHAPGFAVFDDSVPALRDFVLGALRAPGPRVPPPPARADCDLVVPVVLNLVPRPDNDYDARAISVAAPPGHGGSVLDRHMGYMYGSGLHITSESIRRLTDETGTPVGCHGWIEIDRLDPDGYAYEEREEEGDEDWVADHDSPFSWAEQKELGLGIGRVRILLPARETVRTLVDRYLREPERRRPAAPAVPRPSKETTAVSEVPAPRRPEAGEEPSLVERQLRRALHERFAVLMRKGLGHRAAEGTWGRETDRDRARLRRDAEAAPLLASWEAFRARPHGFTALRAVTRSVFHRTRVLVLDGSGVEVGRYHLPDGPLTLVDERARADALGALRAHGIDVGTPERLAELDGFPDASVVVRDGTWSIRLVKEGVPLSGLPEAGWFDADSGTLTVYAAPHAEPLTVLLRRHGVRPLLVTRGAPREEVERHNFRAYFARSEISPFNGTSRVTAGAQGLLPERFREWLAATPEVPVEPDPGSLLPPLVDDASDNPYYRRALEGLFGAPVDTGRRGPCRLCGRSAQSARPGLFYCHRCCGLALGGVLRDNGADGEWTEAVTYALRRLAEIEFSGPPSLAQLARVSVPFSDPALVDEVLLCRFLLPRPGSTVLSTRPERRARTWPEWLQLAGLLVDGVRTAMGTVTTATDGHLCRSLFERHVDDFLHHRGIAHEPEPHYPHHPELNTTGLRADWRLADGTFVEALGLMEREAYAAKVERKRELAAVFGLRLVTVTAADLDRLPEVFAEWVAGAASR